MSEQVSKPLFSTDAAERKKYPIYSGVLGYFPAALAQVARVSYFGNEQHSPGEPLHWARGKTLTCSRATSLISTSYHSVSLGISFQSVRCRSRCIARRFWFSLASAKFGRTMISRHCTGHSRNSASLKSLFRNSEMTSSSGTLRMSRIGSRC